MATLVVSLLLVRVSEPSKDAPRLEMSKNPPKFDLTRLPKFEVPRPADWARAMLHTLESIQPHRPARRHWSDSIRLPMLIISVGALIARLTKPKEASGDWLLRWACRIIYACTVINPFFSVLADDYTFMHDAASSYLIERKRKHSSFTVNQEEAFRRTLIGFGKIRPRRLFALGATLRGIQLHSPLVHIWDPPCQFGTGLNMLALFDGIAWPAVVTLGWAISEKWWRIGRGAVVSASHPKGVRGRTTGSAAHDGAVSTSATTAATVATAAANTTAATAATAAASKHPGPPSPRASSPSRSAQDDASHRPFEIRLPSAIPGVTRPGLHLHFHVPAVHVSAMVATLLLATHRWPWVLTDALLCSSIHWVPHVEPPD